MRSFRAWTVMASVLVAATGTARAQAAGPVPARSDSAAGRPDSTADAPAPPFRFSQEAGLGLRALWEESHAAAEERVACLGATVRSGIVFVDRILALEPREADSMSISGAESVERCGFPEWAGTVHTHVALYTADQPSKRFSAQDRGIMRQWYERWKADGVFCVVYSARDAHCEADGVVGGMRSAPVLR